MLRTPSHQDLLPLLGRGRCRRALQVLPDQLQLAAGVERHRVARDHPRVGDLGDPAALAVEPVDGRRPGSQQVDLLRPDRQPPAAALDQVGDTDEAGDELVARVLVELLGRAHLFDPALVEDGDAVAHRQRLVLVVGDVDEGDADLALDRLQLQLHLLAQLQVEGAERLVEQQHLGPVDDRPRQRHPLALATGELARPAPGVVGQPHHLQRLVAASGPLGPVHPGHPQPVGDVVADGHVREQGVVLEDGVDRTVIRRHAADLLAGEFERAAAGVLEAGDHPQRRRLARAGRPEEGEELAAPHLEVDSRNRDHLAVVLGEASQTDVGW